MHISSNKQEIYLLLNKVINLVEDIKLENCFVPRAKNIVIMKLEEALLWLSYEGRSAPTEQQRGIR